MATPMKHQRGATERLLNRAMPLRPWLLVQPPPRRAEANQEPRQHAHWQGGLDLYRYAAARRQHVNESAEQEAAGDTADPGDPAVQQQQEHGR